MRERSTKEILDGITAKMREQEAADAAEAGVDVETWREQVAAMDRAEAEQAAAVALTRRVNAVLPSRLRGMTFETYEAPNASCADAVVQCQTWCADYHRWALTHKLDESPPSLGMMLSGNPGAGKTHLAASMVRALTELGMRCVFIDIPEFLASIRSTFDGGTAVVTVEQAILAPLLVMDDLGAERETPWAVETLYVIINKRLSENRPMIFTTNLLFADIADRAEGKVSTAISDDGSGLYLRRIYSRLREITGSLLILDAPDYRATMN